MKLTRFSPAILAALLFLSGCGDSTDADDSATATGGATASDTDSASSDDSGADGGATEQEADDTDAIVEPDTPTETEATEGAGDDSAEDPEATEASDEATDTTTNEATDEATEDPDPVEPEAVEPEVVEPEEVQPEPENAPTPAAAGFQLAQVSGVTFDLPEDWLVINDESDISELLESDEFAENIDAIGLDVDALAGQMNLVDLIAIDTSPSAFSSNVNVITSVAPAGLDQLAEINLAQLEQAGFIVAAQEIVDLDHGPTWIVEYSITGTDAAIAAALWLSDGRQFQVTASSGDATEAKSILDNVLISVR